MPLFVLCSGGTFALYSLLCRHSKLSILPNQEASDKELSSYAIEGSADTWQSTFLKSLFEKHPKFQNALLIFVLLGTCMAIGDGILTPAISGRYDNLEVLLNFGAKINWCLALNITYGFSDDKLSFK